MEGATQLPTAVSAMEEDWRDQYPALLCVFLIFS